MKPLLLIRQLTVNRDKTPVLWEIDCEIPQGVLLGILGPNGAGKSTLLKALMGLIPPISGQVLFWQKSLKEVLPRVAYVPQRESIDWDFPITVLQLVLMGGYRQSSWWRWATKKECARALHCLAEVGLKALADRQISQLSGGQQQRLFLARALMQDADLYFLDEPLAGVDAASEEVIMQLLKKLQGEGKSFLVVHHDLQTVTHYFDWLLLLNVRLISCGPTKELFTPETLEKAYGGQNQILDRATRLAQQTSSGQIE